MADLMTVIRKRRSVREYLDKPVEDKKIEQIIEAARLAPSASNNQPWRFVVVKDKALKDELYEKAIGTILPINKWVSTVPVIIAACANPSIPHKIGAGIKKIEYHLLDMGIAGEHLVLAAAELGLGTCWIGWFNEQAVHNVLNIPKGVKVVALITLGYPEKDLELNEKEKLGLDKILHWNKYK